MVRLRGLEPPLLSKLDPKSSASASSAIAAYEIKCVMQSVMQTQKLEIKNAVTRMNRGLQN